MTKKTQAFILITSKLELFSGQSLFLPCFLENKKPFLFHASIPWPENFQVNMHHIYDLVIHKHKTSRDFANLLVVCETCTLKIHKFSYSKKVQKRFFHLANTFTPPSQFAICHHSLLSLSQESFYQPSFYPSKVKGSKVCSIAVNSCSTIYFDLVLLLFLSTYDMSILHQTSVKQEEILPKNSLGKRQKNVS